MNDELGGGVGGASGKPVVAYFKVISQEDYGEIGYSQSRLYPF